MGCLLGQRTPGNVFLVSAFDNFHALVVNADLPGVAEEIKTHNMSEIVAGINVNNGDVAEKGINRCSCLSSCAEICSCTNNDAHTVPMSRGLWRAISMASSNMQSSTECW